VIDTSVFPVPGPRAAATPVVDFWFDPLCPWAWMTSRWMDEVSARRDVEVRWHVMSLAILHESADDTPASRAEPNSAWGPVRVIVAAAQLHGEKYVKSLYDAMGTRLHPGGQSELAVVIDESLAQVGLPSELADHARSEEFDALLRASHQGAIALVGNDVGTPVVAINGVGYFGPVMTPAPRGDAAVRLWDGLVLMTGVPGFYELKRSRTDGPIFAS